MKCDVNWIPLRIRDRTRITQPHFDSWLVASKLKPGKAVIGAKLLRQFNAGSFNGVIVIHLLVFRCNLDAGKYRGDRASVFRK